MGGPRSQVHLPPSAGGRRRSCVADLRRRKNADATNQADRARICLRSSSSARSLIFASSMTSKTRPGSTSRTGAAPGAALVLLEVERIEDGEVSPYLVASFAPGDELEPRGPIEGYFVCEHALGGPLLLLAGSSGIAPCGRMVPTTGRWAAACRCGCCTRPARSRNSFIATSW